MKVLSKSFVFLAVMLTSCSYIEQPYSHYDAHEMALLRGMWIPDIFPHDIIDIHEQHDIDTNEIWLRFTLTKTNIDPRQYGYVSIQPQDLSSILYQPPVTPIWRNKWWLENLSEQTKIFKGKHHHGDGDTVYLAIESTTVYWWSE